jgi:hypothetical protein
LVANRTAARVQDQVEALDEAALASFTSLHNKVDLVDSRLGRVESSLGIIQNSVQGVPACLSQMSDRLFRLERGIDNGVEPPPPPPPQLQQQQQPQLPAAQAVGVVIVPPAVAAALEVQGKAIAGDFDFAILLSLTFVLFVVSPQDPTTKTPLKVGTTMTMPPWTSMTLLGRLIPVAAPPSLQISPRRLLFCYNSGGTTTYKNSKATGSADGFTL